MRTKDKGGWYHLEAIPEKVAISYRGRMNKRGYFRTHTRSKEAVARRRAKRSHKAPYRYKDYHLIENVLDIGIVPKGRYTYHQRRYEKAGRPFKLKQASGFKLASCTKYRCPDIVIKALVKIYDPDNCVKNTRPVKGPKRLRTPRARTRTQTIERLEAWLSDPRCYENIKLFNRVNDTLEEELRLRDRRNHYETYPKDKWPEAIEPLVLHEKWRERKNASKRILDAYYS